MIKGLLFDIGGVLYVGEKPIEGARETIMMLRKTYPMRFLTNATRKTPRSILAKLRGMGFSLKDEELFTALDAARRYVSDRDGRVYTVLTDEAEAWFANLKSDKPDFVVVGDAHTNFDYRRLNGAFRALMEGAELIAAAKNRYFKDEDGELSLDAGGFIAALEYAAGKEAKIVGKPSEAFFRMAVDSMGLEPEEVLMVGDDIESDVKGAQDAGLRAVLVQTGKYREEDLRKGIVPDAVLTDVTALPSLLM